jgi:hypothetical protein
LIEQKDEPFGVNTASFQKAIAAIGQSNKQLDQSLQMSAFEERQLERLLQIMQQQQQQQQQQSSSPKYDAEIPHECIDVVVSLLQKWPTKILFTGKCNFYYYFYYQRIVHGQMG